VALTATSTVLPLRPLTFGELLDAAVALLRAHGRVFLGAALVLAAVEQGLLLPLRHLAHMAPPSYTPDFDRLGYAWLLFAAGMGTEGAILAVLGGFTAVAAGPALLGQSLPARRVLGAPLRRLLLIGLVALVAFCVLAVGALLAIVPWIFLYGLIGPVVPALMVDRIGPVRALGRGVGLAARSGLRAVWLRFGAYLSWLFIRLALGFGGGAALRLVVPATTEWLAITSVVTWLLVDTIAYTMLACFDAVLYLDVRMRTEGLDIAVSRARRLGRPVDLATTAITAGPPGQPQQARR
jgi:hypothetical protein